MPKMKMIEEEGEEKEEGRDRQLQAFVFFSH